MKLCASLMSVISRASLVYIYAICRSRIAAFVVLYTHISIYTHRAVYFRIYIHPYIIYEYISIRAPNYILYIQSGQKNIYIAKRYLDQQYIARQSTETMNHVSYARFAREYRRGGYKVWRIEARLLLHIPPSLAVVAYIYSLAFAMFPRPEAYRTAAHTREVCNTHTHAAAAEY